MPRSPSLSCSRSPCFALPRQTYKGSNRKPSRCCCFRCVSSCWSLRVGWDIARPRAAHTGWARAALHLSKLLQVHNEEKQTSNEPKKPDLESPAVAPQQTFPCRKKTRSHPFPRQGRRYKAAAVRISLYSPPKAPREGAEHCPTQTTASFLLLPTSLPGRSTSLTGKSTSEKLFSYHSLKNMWR